MASKRIPVKVALKFDGNVHAPTNFIGHEINEYLQL